MDRGAVRLGLKFPDLFRGAPALAGGPFSPDLSHTPGVGPHETERILQRIFGGDLEYYAALSPWRLAEQNAEAVHGRTRTRIVVGELDATCDLSREFGAHLTRLSIPRTFTEVPGVGHRPMPLLSAQREENWTFYGSAWLAQDSVCVERESAGP